MFINDIFKKKLNEGGFDIPEIPRAPQPKPAPTKDKTVDEAGPFSYGAKKPRKGSVADLAAQKRKEQEKGKQPIEPKDQRVGTAKIVKELDVRGASAGDQAAYDQYAQVRAKGDILDREASATPSPVSFAGSTQSGFNQDLKPKTQVAQSQLSKDLIAAQTTGLAAQNPEMEKRYTMNKLAVKPTKTNAEIAAQLESQGVAEGKDDLSQYSTERLKAYVEKVSGGGVPAFGSGAKLKRVQAELKRREQGVAEGSYTSQFQSIDDAIIYAKRKIQSFRDTADGIEIYAMPDGGADLVHTMNSNGRRHTIQNGGKKLRTIYANDKQGVVEGSVQDKLYKRHQELRKKSGLPDPDYYKELKASYDLPDEERYTKQKEIKQKYKVTNEDRERYVEELGRAGYEIVNELRMTCPECGGTAYADKMLAEKKDACYSKVKSRYKVWPSAYASGALVRCRKKGAANWGNKSKK